MPGTVRNAAVREIPPILGIVQRFLNDDNDHLLGH